MRLLHTMIRTGDLDRSIAFYTGVLGMRLLRRQDYPEGKFTLAFVGYGDDLVFTRVLDYLDEVLPGLKARIQSSSLTAQMTITEQGHGICVLPSFMAAGRPGLEPVLPEEVRLTRSYWLFTHADLADTARVRTVTRFVQDEIAANRDCFLSGRDREDQPTSAHSPQ